MKKFSIDIKDCDCETGEWESCWNSDVFYEPYECYFPETAIDLAADWYLEQCREDYNELLAQGEPPEEEPKRIGDEVFYKGKCTIFRAVEKQPHYLYSTKLEMIRCEKGLSQKQLSERSGISQQNISMYESTDSKRNLMTARLSTVMKLAEALGCQVEDLI